MLPLFKAFLTNVSGAPAPRMRDAARQRDVLKRILVEKQRTPLPLGDTKRSETCSMALGSSRQAMASANHLCSSAKRGAPTLMLPKQASRGHDLQDQVASEGSTSSELSFETHACVKPSVTSP